MKSQSNVDKKLAKKRTAQQQADYDSKLFAFTQDDEMRIAFSIERAKRFFTRFGRGEKPYMVDLSHYAVSPSRLRKKFY